MTDDEILALCDVPVRPQVFHHRVPPETMQRLLDEGKIVVTTDWKIARRK